MAFQHEDAMATSITAENSSKRYITLTAWPTLRCSTSMHTLARNAKPHCDIPATFRFSIQLAPVGITGASVSQLQKSLHPHQNGYTYYCHHIHYWGCSSAPVFNGGRAGACEQQNGQVWQLHGKEVQMCCCFGGRRKLPGADEE